MATKKKSKSASEEKLRATVTALRKELATTKAKRDRWKKRTIKAEAAVADLTARLKRGDKQLLKAKKRAAKATDSWAAPVPSAATAALATPASQPAAESSGRESSSSAASGPEVSSPDASWTVVQLRAEARRRGLVGVSSKPKAELLAALE